MKRIIIILMFLFCFASIASATELTYKICVPNIWMGTVKWDGEPGKSAYEIRDDLQLKEMGSKTFEVEPGWYGVTVYDHKLNWIKDYADILIGDKHATLEWGCK